MGSRRNAIIAILLASVIPFLSFISNAVVALVILRHGITEGLKVLAWAVLPGCVLAYASGDWRMLAAVLSVATLSTVLHLSKEWQKVLLAAILVGAALNMVMPWLMFDSLQLLLQELLKVEGVDFQGISPDKIATSLSDLLGTSILMEAVVCLLLARWWQAQLYNPGGFQAEFHQLKAPWFISGAALVVWILSAQQAPGTYLSWSILVGIPVVLSGIALLHNLFKVKNINGRWLVTCYLVAFILWSLIYPLLILVVLADAFMDFRSRLNDTTEQ
jgi:hypothetical protein